MTDSAALLPGTLDLLILTAASLGKLAPRTTTREIRA